MATFTQHIREAAAKIKARVAPDADLVDGMTANQVAATITKSDVNLANVVNYGVASDTDVRAGTSTAKYMTPSKMPLAISQALSKMYDTVTDGQILYGDGSDDALACRMSSYVTKTNIAENDAEVEYAKSVEQSFKDVFDTWYRFSHRGSNLPQPVLVNELSSWSYSESLDTVTCTINSSSHVGFVSRDQYDEYTFEVEVSSTNADDDTIGLILAYVKVAGVEYTLTVQRAMGGFRQLFYVAYQMGGADDYTLGSSMNFENYKNGSPGGSHGNNGWSGKTTRIKAIRNGDIITVSATDVNSTTYKTSEDMTIDLSADSRLHKFRGPAAYGYSCYSQALSTFKVLARPGAYQDFLDTRTMTLWRHDGVSWVGTPEENTPGVMPRNRIYMNVDSKKSYYFPLSGNMIKLGDYNTARLEGKLP